MRFFNTSQLDFQGRFLVTGTWISREKGTLAESWSCITVGSASATAAATLHECDRQNINISAIAYPRNLIDMVIWDQF